MAMLSNDIRVGSASNPTYRWQNDKIQSGTSKGIFSVDILGNELAIDTFSAVVRTNVDAPLVYNPSGTPNAYKTRNGGIYLLKKPKNYGQNFLKDIAPGTPVFWYVAGAVFAKGYLQNVQRVGKYLYKITCMSGIGLLDAKTHYGGLYSGAVASTLFSSIIGSSFAYSVDNDVGNTAIYGHLPYDTARNNLHRLLFALGAVMMRDANGNYQVSFLSDSMTNVPTSRIALNGKTEYTIPADSVEITEHAFFALNSDEVVSLFDNSNGAAVSDQLVVFDNPMHDLTVTGNLTISESSVNHAIVSGVGTLSGKQYTHNMMIVKQGTGSNNVKRVEKNELVSFANSYFVANRVYSYYTSTRQIDSKIMLESEKPGTLLSMRDSFGDPTNAYLVSADVLVTSWKGAQCRLISGFVPGSNGNNFSNRALITSNRTWTVPSGVTRIRIVLIGGGQGGQGGYDGDDGLDSTTTPGLAHATNWGLHFERGGVHYYGEGNDTYIYSGNNQPSQSGGAAGEAGEKASFLVSDQNVVANDSIVIVVGAGGAGGARNGGAGAAGTASTAQCSRFGTISSADGLSTYEGYNDPVSGLTFAIDGIGGIAGGYGGRAAAYGNGSTKANNGGACKTYSGGVGGEADVFQDEYDPELEVYAKLYVAAAGAGGGAAYGAVGGDGGNGVIEDEEYQPSPYDPATDIRKKLIGGNGGNGANAIAPEQASVYGQGGTGGNGGGAGGNAGGNNFRDWTYHRADQRATLVPGTKGAGGQGSVGGQGGAGCVIIYY